MNKQADGSGKMKILGLGAPVVDQLVHVSEDFLESIRGEKAGQILIDHAEYRQIREGLQEEVKEKTGGSAANTLKGLARLGSSCALLGMAGNDPERSFLEKTFQEWGVEAYFQTHPIEATAQVLCLVTPDGERTMRTLIGASAHFNGEALEKTVFEGARHLHVEGYQFYALPALKETLRKAKEAGLSISLDLASFEVVEQFRSELTQILSDYVNVVFANEKEASTLVHGNAFEGGDLLQSLCEIVLLTQNKEGCTLFSPEGMQYFSTIPLEAKDSTGAGDLFAAGFLHGYLHGDSLENCVHLASLLGGEITQHLGAEIPFESWEGILARKAQNEYDHSS